MKLGTLTLLLGVLASIIGAIEQWGKTVEKVVEEVEKEKEMNK